MLVKKSGHISSRSSESDHILHNYFLKIIILLYYLLLHILFVYVCESSIHKHYKVPLTAFQNRREELVDWSDVLHRKEGSSFTLRVIELQCICGVRRSAGQRTGPGI